MSKKYPQPESFKGLSYDPDEIPGWTAFIYSENRFREPHEFVDANFDSNTILDELEKVKLDLKREKETSDAQKERILELHEDAREKQGVILQRVTEIDALSDEVDNFKILGQKLKKLMKKYADHQIECDWHDFTASGRIIKNRKQKEKEICNCGYFEALEEFP